MTPDRASVLAEIAGLIPSVAEAGRNVFVGIDGVDGSGKTVFADELAAVLTGRQPVQRISIDGFHRQRAERYRLGRTSPEGFWLDSYDYDAFRGGVLDPLRAGLGPFLIASHDLDSDHLLDGPPHHLSEPSVILIDGIFLHRDELRDAWDFSVFLDVPFTVSIARMAVRDAADPDPAAASNRRYVEGQRLYLAAAAPRSRATVVVDNSELDDPRIARKG